MKRVVIPLLLVMAALLAGCCTLAPTGGANACNREAGGNACHRDPGTNACNREPSATAAYDVSWDAGCENYPVSYRGKQVEAPEVLPEPTEPLHRQHPAANGGNQ